MNINIVQWNVQVNARGPKSTPETAKVLGPEDMYVQEISLDNQIQIVFANIITNCVLK